MKKTDTLSECNSKFKMLFILGTHRTGGNSELISQMIKSHQHSNLIDTEYIYLKDKEIRNCNSCYQCSEHGKCIIDDDVEEVVEVMKKKDVIIFVPVVYGFGLGSIFQAFVERSGYGYLRIQGRPLKDKIASIVVIGRRYAHESVVQQILMNILLNEMVVYGSGFLPLLHGKTFPGEILKDDEGIDSFNRMIDRIIEAVNQKGRRQ